jgi:hypothetical protein
LDIMHRRQALAAFFASTLAGCGGGDGGPPPAPAPSPAPPAPPPPPGGYQGTLRTLAAPLARSDHATAVLPGGEILIVGGSGPESAPPQQVLGFDAATERFVPRGILRSGRFQHSASAVSEHELLVYGGQRSVSGQPVAELLDLRSGLSTAASGAPATDRRDHSATPLGLGKVLLIGGRGASASTVWDTAEVYDLATRTFTLLPSRLLQGRFGHSVLRIDGERLMVFGGRTLAGGPALPEFFHLPTQRFEAAGLPWIEPAPRVGAVAVRAFGGQALFIGGLGGDDAPLASLHRVRPGPPMQGDGAPLRVARARLAAAALSDGRVLVTGGETDARGGVSASTEIIDPATAMSIAGPVMRTPRTGHSTEMLADGRVLIAGGVDAGGAFATAVEIFS